MSALWLILLLLVLLFVFGGVFLTKFLFLALIVLGVIALLALLGVL